MNQSETGSDAEGHTEGDELRELHLAPMPGLLSYVRHETTRFVHAIGGEAILDEAELVASELVSNAFSHTRSGVIVRLGTENGHLRIEVDDDGGGWPCPQTLDLSRTRGRGLLIVGRLADRWGAESRRDAGKTVWCEIRLPPGADSAA